jgi:hypothetical protein
VLITIVRISSTVSSQLLNYLIVTPYLCLLYVCSFMLLYVFFFITLRKKGGHFLFGWWICSFSNATDYLIRNRHCSFLFAEVGFYFMKKFLFICFSFVLIVLIMIGSFHLILIITMWLVGFASFHINIHGSSRLTEHKIISSILLLDEGWRVILRYLLVYFILCYFY